MIVAIGSDHAGFVLKEQLRAWLETHNYEVIDLGTYSEASVDYPHYGAEVGRAGVIRANDDAEMTRRHNNANVACFGERFTEPEVAIAALDIFLTTPFDGGRHERRVEMLAELDDGEAV